MNVVILCFIPVFGFPAILHYAMGLVIQECHGGWLELLNSVPSSNVTCGSFDITVATHWVLYNSNHVPIRNAISCNTCIVYNELSLSVVKGSWRTLSITSALVISNVANGIVKCSNEERGESTECRINVIRPMSLLSCFHEEILTQNQLIITCTFIQGYSSNSSYSCTYYQTRMSDNHVIVFNGLINGSLSGTNVSFDCILNTTLPTEQGHYTYSVQAYPDNSTVNRAVYLTIPRPNTLATAITTTQTTTRSAISIAQSAVLSTQAHTLQNLTTDSGSSPVLTHASAINPDDRGSPTSNVNVAGIAGGVSTAVVVVVLIIVFVIMRRRRQNQQMKTLRSPVVDEDDDTEDHVNTLYVTEEDGDQALPAPQPQTKHQPVSPYHNVQPLSDGHAQLRRAKTAEKPAGVALRIPSFTNSANSENDSNSSAAKSTVQVEIIADEFGYSVPELDDPRRGHSADKASGSGSSGRLSDAGYFLAAVTNVHGYENVPGTFRLSAEDPEAAASTAHDQDEMDGYAAVEQVTDSSTLKPTACHAAPSGDVYAKVDKSAKKNNSPAIGQSSPEVGVGDDFYSQVQKPKPGAKRAMKPKLAQKPAFTKPKPEPQTGKNGEEGRHGEEEDAYNTLNHTVKATQLPRLDDPESEYNHLGDISAE